MGLLSASTGHIIVRVADSNTVMKEFVRLKNSQEKRCGYFGKTKFQVSLAERAQTVICCGQSFQGCFY